MCVFVYRVSARECVCVCVDLYISLYSRDSFRAKSKQGGAWWDPQQSIKASCSSPFTVVHLTSLNSVQIITDSCRLLQTVADYYRQLQIITVRHGQKNKNNGQTQLKWAAIRQCISCILINCHVTIIAERLSMREHDLWSNVNCRTYIYISDI